MSAALLFLKKECKPMVPVEDVMLVSALLDLLSLLYTRDVIKVCKAPLRVSHYVLHDAILQAACAKKDAREIARELDTWCGASLCFVHARSIKRESMLGVQVCVRRSLGLRINAEREGWRGLPREG